MQADLEGCVVAVVVMLAAFLFTVGLWSTVIWFIEHVRIVLV